MEAMEQREHRRPAGRPVRRGRNASALKGAGVRDLWPSAALLAFGIVFGGGGSPHPYPELVVELASIWLAVVSYLIRRPIGFAWQADRKLWICVAAFAVPFVIQLIPLPPFIWQALPGRETAREALALVGEASSWRPISLSPAATLASLLSLIPPVAAIYLIAQLPLLARTRLLAVLAALGFVAALVGLLQLSSGNSNLLRFYKATHYGFATGFQANRNAQGDVLLIAALALAMYASARSRLFTSWLSRGALGVGLIFLVASVFTTGSRTATALVLVLLLFCSAPWLPAARQLERGRLIAILCGAGLVIAGVSAAAFHNGVIDRTVNRFGATSESRPAIWEGAVFAFDRFNPVGSGIGTIAPVLASAETLEVVDSTRPNRAHNDYLEFAVEAGPLGLALVVALAALFVARVTSLIRRSPSLQQRRQALFALGTAAIIGLHSLVDYPMRSMALSIMAGVAIGLVSRIPGGNEDSHGFE